MRLPFLVLLGVLVVGVEVANGRPMVPLEMEENGSAEAQSVQRVASKSEPASYKRGSLQLERVDVASLDARSSTLVVTCSNGAVANSTVVEVSEDNEVVWKDSTLTILEDVPLQEGVATVNCTVHKRVEGSGQDHVTESQSLSSEKLAEKIELANSWLRAYKGEDAEEEGLAEEASAPDFDTAFKIKGDHEINSDTVKSGIAEWEHLLFTDGEADDVLLRVVEMVRELFADLLGTLAEDGHDNWLFQLLTRVGLEMQKYEVDQDESDDSTGFVKAMASIAGSEDALQFPLGELARMDAMLQARTWQRDSDSDEPEMGAEEWTKLMVQRARGVEAEADEYYARASLLYRLVEATTPDGMVTLDLESVADMYEKMHHIDIYDEAHQAMKAGFEKTLEGWSANLAAVPEEDAFALAQSFEAQGDLLMDSVKEMWAEIEIRQQLYDVYVDEHDQEEREREGAMPLRISEALGTVCKSMYSTNTSAAMEYTRVMWLSGKTAYVQTFRVTSDNLQEQDGQLSGSIAALGPDQAVQITVNWTEKAPAQRSGSSAKSINVGLLGVAVFSMGCSLACILYEAQRRNRAFRHGARPPSDLQATPSSESSGAASIVMREVGAKLDPGSKTSVLVDVEPVTALVEQPGGGISMAVVVQEPIYYRTTIASAAPSHEDLPSLTRSITSADGASSRPSSAAQAITPSGG